MNNGRENKVDLLDFNEDTNKEMILDHYRNPRNWGIIKGANVYRIFGQNPLCNDKIELYMHTNSEQTHIQELKFTGHGCTLCIASASILSEITLSMLQKNCLITDIVYLVREFRKNIHTPGDWIFSSHLFQDVQLSDIRCLLGVYQYPIRVKCVLLAWNLFQTAIDDHIYVP